MACTRGNDVSPALQSLLHRKPIGKGLHEHLACVHMLHSISVCSHNATEMRQKKGCRPMWPS